jgi:hypothetical protein
MPRIHLTRTVKIALYFLRIYLILLLGLIILKFVLMFTGGKKNEAPVQSAPHASQQLRDSSHSL